MTGREGRGIPLKLRIFVSTTLVPPHILSLRPSVSSGPSPIPARPFFDPFVSGCLIRAADTGSTLAIINTGAPLPFL